MFPDRIGYNTHMDNADLSGLAQETIRLRLKEQGLAPRTVEGTLLLGVGDLLCRCEILPVGPEMHPAIVPVAVEIVLPEPGRTIREIMVGLSENRQEAVTQAMDRWAEGVFPPIHHVFADLPEEDPRIEVCHMVSQNVENGDVTDWKILLGPTQVSGWNKEITAGVLGTDTLLRSFRNPLFAASRDPRLHWIKIYLARQPDGDKVLECKLDNEHWEEGKAALQGLPLPRDSHFVHLRRFLTMKPSPHTGELPGGAACHPRTFPWWQFWKRSGRTGPA